MDEIRKADQEAMAQDTLAIDEEEARPRPDAPLLDEPAARSVRAVPEARPAEPALQGECMGGLAIRVAVDPEDREPAPGELRVQALLLLEEGDAGRAPGRAVRPAPSRRRPG